MDQNCAKGFKQCKFVPYIEVNGKWSIPDDMIIRFFNSSMTGKGLFPMSNMLSHEFITGIKSKKWVVGAWVKGPRVVFLVWLNLLNGASAHIHFAAHKSVFGDTVNVLWKKTIKYWFLLLGEGLQTIYGYVPADNTKALRFLLKTPNVKKVGTVPSMGISADGKLIDFVIFYTARLP